MTVVDRLNELLEAERAGVETLSRLFPEARTPEMLKLFEQVRDDEAWSCAGLARAIKTLGGVMSEKKGDFAEKVMSEPTLTDRLRLLNRGQGWVVKRLDGLLDETLPESVSGFLKEMKTRHIANIEACDRLAESLAQAEGQPTIARCPTHGIAYDVEREQCPECAKSEEKKGKA